MKKETVAWICLGGIAFFFSSLLMWQTFGYDASSKTMLIAPKAWSDFGAHIPLIRSFSLGDNWPPQSPLYPGVPIQYHFLFYFLVGMLEKIGVRIDWALNLVSSIGLTALILLIAVCAKKLYKNMYVAVIAVVLFCCNSSLSFIRFFDSHPLSVHTIMDIMQNTKFAAFGPWDGQSITAFWTMNIYTNQRHLGLSYALALLAVLIALGQWKKKQWMIQTGAYAIVMATLLFLNQAVALIAFIWLGWLFILKKDIRLPLCIAALWCTPVLWYYHTIIGPAGAVTIEPGYVLNTALSPKSISTFWWQNLGLSLFMIPLGWLVSPKKVKAVTGVPLLILFVAPNIWQFSPDMINNHKFFNFFIIVGNMLSAYAIVWLWNTIRTKTIHKSIRDIGYALVATIVFFLTLSGVIDIFPIFNESRMELPDVPKNQDAEFFLTHTKPTDVILNSTWFYHPASIAGRKLFSGYTYFTWSYGYDQKKREDIQVAIYEAHTKQEACTLLKKNNIAYVELSDKPESFLKPNTTMFKQQFTEIYYNPETGIHVYSTRGSCMEL